MGTLIFIFFNLLLLFVFLYSLSQLHLLISFLKRQQQPTTNFLLDLSNPDSIPMVTIQLPLYNEKSVVERLLRCIATIEYPREKLQVQVLDDSTDDSVVLTEEIVRELHTTGLDIQHLRRRDRKGYKAGALKDGLSSAKGEFIAIFDADFLPTPNWLLRTLPHFRNDKIGVVQTRWGHLNREYSLLTRIQAFALDFHFTLEQNGRDQGGHFINFNGTAGVWRKSCILDSGNWSGDTLTEDLDLSYRAQLKGWKFSYVGEVETPSELPITIEAARSQQFRWNKGGAENFRKNFKHLFQSSHQSFLTKYHGFYHLLNSSLFLIILLLSVLSLPLLFLASKPPYQIHLHITTFFGLSTLILFFCHGLSAYWGYEKAKPAPLKFLLMFLGFFSIAMGFALHNSKAVLEGHVGKKSAFIRTPKYNITSNKKISPAAGVGRRLNFQLGMECLLLLCFGSAIYAAFTLETYGFLGFHLMLFFGYGFVVYESIKSLLRSKPEPPAGYNPMKV